MWVIAGILWLFYALDPIAKIHFNLFPVTQEYINEHPFYSCLMDMIFGLISFYFAIQICISFSSVLDAILLSRYVGKPNFRGFRSQHLPNPCQKR